MAKVQGRATVLSYGDGVETGRLRCGARSRGRFFLEKPGKLTDREWQAMRAHAGHTQAILGRIGAFADMAPLAAAHHERLDGKGYPLGLDDRAIGVETRIITLCDVFDALTSDRPYRAAMPVERALAVIQADVGTAFDGEGFEALKAIV